jgi:hypothetical protein
VSSGGLILNVSLPDGQPVFEDVAVNPYYEDSEYVLSRSGEGRVMVMINLSTVGVHTGYKWYIDGIETPETEAYRIGLDAGEYELGPHELSFVAETEVLGETSTSERVFSFTVLP